MELDTEVILKISLGAPSVCLAVGGLIYALFLRVKQHLARKVEFQRIWRERQVQLSAEVEKRQVEEAKEDAGSQIWFSRYSHQQSLQRWAMIIENTKYELALAETGTFIFRKQSWDLAKEKREALLTERSSLATDGCHLCLIGWTALPSEEIVQIANQAMTVPSDLLWSECQVSLRAVVDRIITDKAADWAWFEDNMKTGNRIVKILSPPPDAILFLYSQMALSNFSNNISRPSERKRIQQNVQRSKRRLQQSMYQSIWKQILDQEAAKKASQAAEKAAKRAGQANIHAGIESVSAPVAKGRQDPFVASFDYIWGKIRKTKK